MNGVIFIKSLHSSLNAKIGQSRFRNSEILFNKFMLCLTIAGKSAFSKNNGSIAMIDAGLTDACCTGEL